MNDGLTNFEYIVTKQPLSILKPILKKTSLQQILKIISNSKFLKYFPTANLKNILQQQTEILSKLKLIFLFLYPLFCHLDLSKLQICTRLKKNFFVCNMFRATKLKISNLFKE